MSGVPKEDRLPTGPTFRPEKLVEGTKAVESKLPVEGERAENSISDMSQYGVYG